MPHGIGVPAGYGNNPYNLLSEPRVPVAPGGNWAGFRSYNENPADYYHKSLPAQYSKLAPKPASITAEDRLRNALLMQKVYENVPWKRSNSDAAAADGLTQEASNQNSNTNPKQEQLAKRDQQPFGPDGPGIQQPFPHMQPQAFYQNPNMNMMYPGMQFAQGPAPMKGLGSAGAGAYGGMIGEGAQFPGYALNEPVGGVQKNDPVGEGPFIKLTPAGVREMQQQQQQASSEKVQRSLENEKEAKQWSVADGREKKRPAPQEVEKRSAAEAEHKTEEASDDKLLFEGILKNSIPAPAGEGSSRRTRRTKGSSKHKEGKSD